MAPCGLPVSWAQFNSSATVTEFNMTADCTVTSDMVGGSYLWFESQAFTINGNGYSIIGPPNQATIYAFSGATLNLNDVIIRQNTHAGNTAVNVFGARLNARNVIFRDNAGDGGPLSALANGQVYLENVQFLNNRKTGTSTGVGSAINVAGNNVLVSVTNGIFRGNAGRPYVIGGDAAYTGTSVQLQGCVTFQNNIDTGSTPASSYGGPATITDSNTGACPAAGFSYWLSLTPAPTSEARNQPKKKEKLPTATATATPRPQIAATHVALQAATGATFGTTYGLDSGVHFRQLDGAGIGIQSIIDAGYLEAFDVWGYVEQGVEVCFPQIGRVVFLDANTSPRAIVPLASTIVNGQTCVSINSPGSLVLLPN